MESKDLMLIEFPENCVKLNSLNADFLRNIDKYLCFI